MLQSSIMAVTSARASRQACDICGEVPWVYSCTQCPKFVCMECSFTCRQENCGLVRCHVHFLCVCGRNRGGAGPASFHGGCGRGGARAESPPPPASRLASLFADLPSEEPAPVRGWRGGRVRGRGGGSGGARAALPVPPSAGVEVPLAGLPPEEPVPVRRGGSRGRGRGRAGAKAEDSAPPSSGLATLFSGLPPGRVRVRHTARGQVGQGKYARNAEWKKKMSIAKKRIHHRAYRLVTSADQRRDLQARVFNASGAARTRDDQHVIDNRAAPGPGGRKGRGFAKGFIRIVPKPSRGRGGWKKWTGPAICQSGFAPPEVSC